MQIKTDYNLSKLNTFGVNVNAKFFTEVESETDVKELFSLPEFKNNSKIFLGGGSNILFTKDFDGIVVLNKLKGIKIVEEDSDSVCIRAMGGESWHSLVEFTVNLGYWGIENLSLVPGTVGAAPMQNIGAYGVELKDTLLNLEAFEINTSEKITFNKDECVLGYRDSIFKSKAKGKYFIFAVTLKLSKKEKRNVEYKVLSDFLEENKIIVKSSKDISDAVSSIRRSKLPDPKIIPNAGSFFKNFIISKEAFPELLVKHPDIKFFEEENTIKIPSGWLIEQCGWKGFRVGNVGVHDKQALVLVNYGGATGGEILELARKIMLSIKDKFGLELVPEVNIV